MVVRRVRNQVVSGLMHLGALMMSEILQISCLARSAEITTIRDLLGVRGRIRAVPGRRTPWGVQRRSGRSTSVGAFNVGRRGAAGRRGACTNARDIAGLGRGTGKRRSRSAARQTSVEERGSAATPVALHPASLPQRFAPYFTSKKRPMTPTSASRSAPSETEMRQIWTLSFFWAAFVAADSAPWVDSCGLITYT